MDKEHIINEIQRTAESGKALGQERFANETGIKVHWWKGRYWANWGDAIKEAGFGPNEWSFAYEDLFIVESLLQLTRKLDKFPTRSQMDLERRSNKAFPSVGAISRHGGRAELVELLIKQGQSRQEYADVIEILHKTSVKKTTDHEDEESAFKNGGYVYLVSAQASYKIGCTRAPYRRVAEIANQSASGAELLHLIQTDDPEGIEKYWHKRFDDKRMEGKNKQSGEWFKLSKEDVRAFKLRKSFM